MIFFALKFGMTVSKILWLMGGGYYLILLRAESKLSWFLQSATAAEAEAAALAPAKIKDNACDSV